MKKIVIVTIGILFSLVVSIEQSNGISIKDFIKSKSFVVRGSNLNRRGVETVQETFDFTTEDFSTTSNPESTTVEPSTELATSTTEPSTELATSTTEPSVETTTEPTSETSELVTSTREPSTEFTTELATEATTEANIETTTSTIIETTTEPNTQPTRTTEANETTTEDYGTTFLPTTTTTRKPIDRDVCPIGSETPAAFPHTENKVSTSCGEYFDCKTGGIFYKPFETVVPNERCIWTLAVPNANGYDITVQYYGYEPKQNNDDDHGLIISEFRRTQAPRHFIPTTVNTTTTTNTAMVMITFFTGPEVNNKAGFILQFKSRFDGALNPPVNTNSKHLLVGSEQYYYKYGALDTYQLGSTIFMPKDNIYRPGRENRAVYMLESLYNCNFEQLKIYFFNTTCVGPNKWEYQGRICGTSPAQELIKSPEPMVVIFESSTVPYARLGFHFTYAASC